jgi:transcriptional regulator with XRE-family HTH domain
LSKAPKKLVDESETLGARIRRARMDAGFNTQIKFADRLGVSRQAVSIWEKDKSHPSAERLRKIAEICNVDFDHLATGRHKSRSQSLHAAANIVSVVEAEAWREGISMKEKIANGYSASETVPSLSSPDLLGMRQFAVRAQGNSANLIIWPDEYAMCVAYKDMRPNGPQSGDPVVIEKRRNSEFKSVVARLRLVKGCWEAGYESSDPRWQNEPPIRFTKESCDERDGCSVEILGLVMASTVTRIRGAKTL